MSESHTDALQDVWQAIKQARADYLAKVRYSYAFQHILFGEKVILDTGALQLYTTQNDARTAGVAVFDSLEEETRKSVLLVELMCDPDGSVLVTHWYSTSPEFWWPCSATTLDAGAFLNTRGLDKVEF